MSRKIHIHWVTVAEAVCCPAAFFPVGTAPALGVAAVAGGAAGIWPGVTL